MTTSTSRSGKHFSTGCIDFSYFSLSSFLFFAFHSSFCRSRFTTTEGQVLLLLLSIWALAMTFIHVASPGFDFATLSSNKPALEAKKAEKKKD